MRREREDELDRKMSASSVRRRDMRSGDEQGQSAAQPPQRTIVPTAFQQSMPESMLLGQSQQRAYVPPPHGAPHGGGNAAIHELLQQSSMRENNPSLGHASLAASLREGSYLPQQLDAINRLRRLREVEALATELEIEAAIRRAQQRENLVRRLSLSQALPPPAPTFNPYSLSLQSNMNPIDFQIPPAAGYASLPATAAATPAPAATMPTLHGMIPSHTPVATTHWQSVLASNTIPNQASLPPSSPAAAYDRGSMSKISPSASTARKRFRETEAPQTTAKDQHRSYHKKKGDTSTDDDDDDGDSTIIKNNNMEAMTQVEQWDALFKQLCKYREIHGNCLVPQHTAENPRLARWVKRQRYQYKLMTEGKKGTNMTEDRVQKLQAVGFVWDSHSATWEERLGELKAYKQANGHCNVPITYQENRKLAAWVKCQRRQYKLLVDGEPSNLTPERVTALNTIGFEWKLRYRKEEINN